MAKNPLPADHMCRLGFGPSLQDQAATRDLGDRCVSTRTPEELALERAAQALRFAKGELSLFWEGLMDADLTDEEEKGIEAGECCQALIRTVAEAQRRLDALGVV